MQLKGIVTLLDLGISKNLFEITKKVVEIAISGSLGSIRVKVSSILDVALEQSDEWKSILGGRLRQEFGLANPQDALNKIKDALVRSVEVEQTYPPGAYGGIRVNILPNIIESELATSLAYQSKGGEVDWLSWLLFRGSSIVVTDATFQTYENPIKGSRAGFSLMIKKSPLGYSVSPEFAGVESSNWFSKVIEPLGQETLNIMFNEVKQRI